MGRPRSAEDHPYDPVPGREHNISTRDTPTIGTEFESGEVLDEECDDRPVAPRSVAAWLALEATRATTSTALAVGASRRR